ncbi:MAG: ribose-5-phosphate isomerase A [Rhodopseudomonas palustris]|nr:ribose-5-phosphate isomerase A [Rhodopseudomonas palustris]
MPSGRCSTASRPSAAGWSRHDPPGSAQAGRRGPCGEPGPPRGWWSGSGRAAPPSSRSNVWAKLIRTGALRDIVGIPELGPHRDDGPRSRHPAHGFRGPPGDRPHDRRGRRGRPGPQPDQGRGRAAARESPGPGHAPQRDHRGREQARAPAGHALGAARGGRRPSPARRGPLPGIHRGPCEPALPGQPPVPTDQGNLLLDAAFGPMADPAAIAQRLDGRAGIVEHGLFLGLAHDVIVAGREGIRALEAARDGRRELQVGANRHLDYACHDPKQERHRFSSGRNHDPADPAEPRT